MYFGWICRSWSTEREKKVGHLGSEDVMALLKGGRSGIGNNSEHSFLDNTGGRHSEKKKQMGYSSTYNELG